MSDLLPRFQQKIRELGLRPDQENSILLAVSGGLDSMVMLHLCRQASLPVIVAHCNFQLRGDESDEDEKLVKITAREWGITYFYQRFFTADHAKDEGLSIQVAARNLRYEWFEELCELLDLSHIATAHHLNDHAETALINWVRGTGLAGLTGIPEKGMRTNGQIPVIRPMLSFTRAEILAYAKEHAIVWREDSSNEKTDYTRNFIRKRVIPALEEIQPDFLHVFERSAAHLRETSLNYQYLLEKAIEIQPVQENTCQIDIAPLRQLPSPSSALRELLKPYGFNPEQARQIAENLDKTGLDIYSSTGNRLTVDRTRLLLQLVSDEQSDLPALIIEENDLMVKIPDGSRLFFTQAGQEQSLPDGREAIITDQDKLVFPLQLRLWRPGDVFQPFGMNGKRKKIVDFLTDLKVARPEKERTWVLINGNSEVIWVVGFRLDNRYKVEKSTEKMLKISLIR